jgi:hypothetical protein
MDDQTLLRERDYRQQGEILDALRAVLTSCCNIEETLTSIEDVLVTLSERDEPTDEENVPA